MSLPTDYKARKEFPLLTVLTAYFPDAIEALVELCKQGNVQHAVDDKAVNPFKLPTDRVTWDRAKSNEQTETAMRHLWDHERAKRGVGSLADADGHLHIIKSMWRTAAEAQLTIEKLRDPKYADYMAEQVLVGPADPMAELTDKIWAARAALVDRELTQLANLEATEAVEKVAKEPREPFVVTSCAKEADEKWHSKIQNFNKSCGVSTCYVCGSNAGG